MATLLATINLSNSNKNPEETMSNSTVIIVGMGEVGRPLFEILNRAYRCTIVDVSPVETSLVCSVMHVCYPFHIPDFVGTTSRYVAKYQPELTIINSTVAPGTTRKVQEAVQRPVVYSPVRGKHAKMKSDLLHYRKFVAGLTPEPTQQADDHFSKAGFSTATFPSPEIAELSKLIETTWLGILVGWAQEIERIACRHGGTYEDVNSFIQEIDFLPSQVFPGHIGGHCVMSNIRILQDYFSSRFLDAVVESNQTKLYELQAVALESKKICSKSV
jgi:UDP-glucose 6-dehydrogenase